MRSWTASAPPGTDAVAFAYLDSCTVIYFVERTPLFAERIDSALFAKGNSVRALVSDLTRLECRVGPKRQVDAARLYRYDAFFSLDRIEHAALDSDTFEIATDLRAQHGLKVPDALHLAAAIRHGCDEIWTNDRRLAAAAQGHLRVVTFATAP